MSQIPNFSDVIVSKPWGFEYLAYENKDVGLWLLRIEKGESTSMHCHPKKNTGLVLLEGKAEISFLNDKVILEAPSKMMLRRGLFHSTRAISDEGLYMLEVECPPIKEDLVRLKDNYGRKNKPYEGRERRTYRNEDCLLLKNDDINKGPFNFHGRTLNLITLNQGLNQNDIKEEQILMCLAGGLSSENDDLIYRPGDVISGKLYKQLLKDFEIIENSLILFIS